MSALTVLSMTGTYGLKPRFQNVLRPIARGLAGAGATANMVTLTAATMSIATGTTLLLLDRPRWFLLLPLVFFLRMALNAIDGMMAREFGQASRLGAYLNELGDVVSDIFLILPFAHMAGFSPFWIWIVVVTSVLTEMAAVMAAPRRNEGPLGKSDRAVVFGALGFWIGIAGGVPPAVATYLPRVLALLLAITVVNRVRGGLR